MTSLLSAEHGAGALEKAAREADGFLAIEVDPDGRRGKPTVLAFSTARDRWVVDLSSFSASFERVLEALPTALVAYDAKEVARGLLALGYRLPNRWACLRVTESLIAGGRRGPTDAQGLADHYGVSLPPASAGLESLADVPMAWMQVARRQVDALRDGKLTWTSRIESQVLPVLAAMEHTGFAFDAEGWRNELVRSREERLALRHELYSLLQAQRGQLFSDASVLENDAGLRDALSATGYDVPNLKKGTLAALPAPLGSMLVRFRELGKLTQAYGETFIEAVQSDGRLRPTFEQIGAPTGRMACHSPNLQSVVKDERYRRCFRAPPGRLLITADYSSCELRILAELSGDPVFVNAFAEGQDLHAAVATTVFGKPVSKTENPELRHRAKSINFGLAYGMGAMGLAQATGLSPQDARNFLERYFASFPRIRDFLEHSAEHALARGYALTMTGRRLYLQHDGTSASRGRASRVAKNMPIQGTNADVMKIALSRLHHALHDVDAALVNSVHDEIIVEVAEAASGTVEKVVRREMEAAGADVLKTIPLEVDTHVSRNWTK